VESAAFALDDDFINPAPQRLVNEVRAKHDAGLRLQFFDQLDKAWTAFGVDVDADAFLFSIYSPELKTCMLTTGEGHAYGARNQTSRSSSVVKITGMAFGWIGSTTAFDEVVRKPCTR
jgi:hypothetical protein